MNSVCHGVSVYYRQVDGEGEALPHCSSCHKPCEVEEEKDEEKEE